MKPIKGTISDQVQVDIIFDCSFEPNIQFKQLKDKIMIQAIEKESNQDDQQAEQVLKNPNSKFQSIKTKIYVNEEGFDMKSRLFANKSQIKQEDQSEFTETIIQSAELTPGESYQKKYQEINQKYFQLSEKCKQLSKERDYIYLKNQTDLKVDDQKSGKSMKFIYLIIIWMSIVIGVFQKNQENQIILKRNEMLNQKETKGNLEIKQKKQQKKKKKCDCRD